MEDSPVFIAAKAAIPGLAGVAGSVAAAATENTTIAVGSTLAVLVGFSALLIQQVVKNQRAVWAIVEAKDNQIDDLRDELHRCSWNGERYRHRLGEGPDPGAYVPRPRRDHHA